METPLVNPASVSPMVEVKPRFSNKKKILIIASLVAVILLLAVAFIASRLYAPSKNAPEEVVSMPISEAVNPKVSESSIELVKACPAENQDFIVNVPQDWECGKYSLENPLIRDLAVRNSNITIAFPLDVQSPIGCGIGATGCTNNSIYTSSKVTRLDLIVRNGVIESVLSTINTPEFSTSVAITFTDNSKTELTPDEKALIIKILEGIEPKVVTQTNSFEFTLDNTGAGGSKINLKVTAPKDSLTSVPSVGANWPAYKFENDDYAMQFVIPYEAFENHFVEKTEVGVLGNIGSMVYRVRTEAMGGLTNVYTNDTRVINNSTCTAFGQTYDAPCGLPLLKVKGSETGLNISCTLKTSESYAICDAIIRSIQLI